MWMMMLQYWMRFIPKFSFIEYPFHALTNVKNTFQWEGKKQKDFNILKEKISTAPVLALLNLQQPIEIETHANGYAMGTVFLSRPPIVASIILKNTSLSRDSYVE